VVQGMRKRAPLRKRRGGKGGPLHGGSCAPVKKGKRRGGEAAYPKALAYMVEGGGERDGPLPKPERGRISLLHEMGRGELPFFFFCR